MRNKQTTPTQSTTDSENFNLVPFKEFIWVRKHSKDWIRLAQNDCPKIGNWLVIYIAFNLRKLWREQKICLTWPLRTVMVTISFFSQAFSYTTLIGSSPAPPVFSHIVMLLLAIKSAFTVDRKQAKNTRMLCIFIFWNAVRQHWLVGVKNVYQS